MQRSVTYLVRKFPAILEPEGLLCYRVYISRINLCPEQDVSSVHPYTVFPATATATPACILPVYSSFWIFQMVLVRGLRGSAVHERVKCAAHHVIRENDTFLWKTYVLRVRRPRILFGIPRYRSRRRRYKGQHETVAGDEARDLIL
jgi:hypothetical protein